MSAMKALVLVLLLVVLPLLLSLLLDVCILCLRQSNRAENGEEISSNHTAKRKKLTRNNSTKFFCVYYSREIFACGAAIVIFSEEKSIIWSESKEKKSCIVCAQMGVKLWNCACSCVPVTVPMPPVCGCVLWFCNFVLLISGFRTIALIFPSSAFFSSRWSFLWLLAMEMSANQIEKRNVVTFVLFWHCWLYFSVDLTSRIVRVVLRDGFYILFESI